jgi:putative transposase
MVQNHHLVTSINDAGWAACPSILSGKAACAGSAVLAVNPAFTNQTCAGGGGLVAMGLSVRWHACPACVSCMRNEPASRPHRGEEQ